MFSTSNFFRQGVLIQLFFVLFVSNIYAQSNSNIYQEYSVDEFTGKIWITPKKLPNNIEVKTYDKLDSATVSFNFKREPDTSTDSNNEELISYSEFWIVLYGVVKKYDYEYEYGASCYEGLSKIYLLADGERIIRDICVTWPNENSTTYYLPLSTSDLLKIGTAKEFKFRIYGNIININDTGIYILNEFIKDVRKYF